MFEKVTSSVDVLRIAWQPSYADHVSSEYWRTQVESQRDMTEDRWNGVAEAVEAQLQLRAGDRILDYGCGHGELAAGLAKRGHDVVGCDISESLMAGARELAVECHQVEKIYEMGCSFDKIYMRGVFMYVHPRRRAEFLLRIRHLLAPGGSLFLLAEPDFRKRYSYPGAHRAQLALARLFPVYATFNAGFWTNEDQLRRHAVRAGFTGFDALKSEAAYRTDFVLRSSGGRPAVGEKSS